MEKAKKKSSTPPRPASASEEDIFDMALVMEASSLSKTGLVIGGSVFALLFVASLFGSSNGSSNQAPPIETPAESAFNAASNDGNPVADEAAAAAAKPDRVTSTTFPDLAEACNSADTPAAGDRCNDLAIKYHNGTEVKKDALRAVNIYDLGCAKGSMTACANAGMMYSGTDGVQPWPENSFRLLTRACAAELAHGCAELGYNYENGVGVAKDIVRARQLYDWACNRGWQKGCDSRDILDRSGS